uniref:Uncharacterized protein n=1 Tax=Kalanchoe fedtschenkoi TaxID=63787 RepID=A0A7N0VHB7_KALFE
MASFGGQVSRSRDLDKLLLRPGHLVGPDFDPGTDLREGLKEFVKILVVGAGGLGCELLKDLAQILRSPLVRELSLKRSLESESNTVQMAISREWDKCDLGEASLSRNVLDSLSWDSRNDGRPW